MVPRPLSSVCAGVQRCEYVHHGCLGGAAGPRAGNVLTFRTFCEMVFQSVNVPVVLYLYQPLESPIYRFQSSYWLQRYLRLHFSDN